MFYWLILFVVIFLAINAVSKNQAKAQRQRAKAEVQKCRICPECAEGIKVEAKKCRYCGISLMQVTEDELAQIDKAYALEISKIENMGVTQPKNKKYQNNDVWK
ncbi:hypothetical protein GCM10009347_40870 [Shewanella algicola]|uniref:Uncharacterized protein n=1 Tax=Shewanella algicola TaxID=640633 RepID=A0A9X1Z790_9GAMM|nr:hypothetical protein [Shewanella algicola]MCL1107686.1 hypothetical protein [Shewanella algicola]GGP71896.1 hypothetical protein GCM10009347_40870 [Shewanella algicola]